jgi:hypothetical protein
MNLYSSAHMRSVSADSMREAAEIFANRLARKAYGRRAYARTCNLNSWSQDNALGEYEAFVGYRTGTHETTGHNERFTVTLVKAQGQEGGAE